MDRKLRRSGDGARIAGMLELDDLGILGGVDKNVFKNMTYMQTTPWPVQAEEKYTRYYCSRQWRKTIADAEMAEAGQLQVTLPALRSAEKGGDDCRG